MLTDFYGFHYAYMAIFFIAINIILISYKLKSHQQLFLAFLALFITQLLFGLRAENIGLDTQSYANLAAGEEHVTAKELTFAFFAQFLYFDSSPQLFFIFSSLAIGACFLIAAYKIDQKSYLLTVAVLLSTFFYLIINISAIRQGLALGLSAIALAQITQGRIRSAALWSVIATSIHHSAAVTVFYLIAYVANKTKFRWTIAFSLIVVFYFASDALYLVLVQIQHFHYAFGKALWYLTWEAGTPWRLKHFYYIVLAFLAFAFIVRKRLTENESFFMICNLMGFAVIALTKIDEMLADRLYYYFIFPGIACVSSIALRIYLTGRNGFLVAAPAVNAWFFGTAILQYPNWFIPPFSAIAQ